MSKKNLYFKMYQGEKKRRELLEKENEQLKEIIKQKEEDAQHMYLESCDCCGERLHESCDIMIYESTGQMDSTLCKDCYWEDTPSSACWMTDENSDNEEEIAEHKKYLKSEEGKEEKKRKDESYERLKKYIDDEKQEEARKVIKEFVEKSRNKCKDCDYSLTDKDFADGIGRVMWCEGPNIDEGEYRCGKCDPRDDEQEEDFEGDCNTPFSQSNPENLWRCKWCNTNQYLFSMADPSMCVHCSGRLCERCDTPVMDGHCEC